MPNPSLSTPDAPVRSRTRQRRRRRNRAALATLTLVLGGTASYWAFGASGSSDEAADTAEQAVTQEVSEASLNLLDGRGDLVAQRSAERVQSGTEPFELPTSGANSVAPIVVPDITGQLWVNEAVNIRSEADTGAEQVAVAARGEQVDVTGESADGWTQLVWDEEEAWVRSSYLQESEPVDEPVAASGSSDGGQSSDQAADADGGSQESESGGSESGGGESGGGESDGGSGGVSNANCPISSSIESSLAPNALATYRAVCAAFPGVASSYGGYRAGDPGDHGSGRAVDIMVTGEPGWQIARYLQANASSLGVTYVIYQQQIWMAGSPHSAWRGMEDRGGATANHFDHVHVSVN